MKPINSITLKTNHIFNMTDDTGMFQHSIYGVPDLSKGYTTDDNARALIMAIMLYDEHGKKQFEKLIYEYISFLNYAQNEDGTFRNFMGYNREFLEKEGSQDCFGRCLWALCFTLANLTTPLSVKKIAWQLIEKSLPHCIKLSSPRAKAYAIIGLACLEEEKAVCYIRKMAMGLAEQYDHYNVNDWHWFEDSVTYCNSVLPWAMICAYRVTKIERYLQIGLESLEFLESKTFCDGFFKPIGCNGWLVKGKESAEFDEQPVEACEMMLAYLEAHAVTGNQAFLSRSKTCFSWFFGHNSKKLRLIDEDTGGCYDGIIQDGLNYNQGAESVVSFWIAWLSIKNTSLHYTYKIR